MIYYPFALAKLYKLLYVVTNHVKEEEDVEQKYIKIKQFPSYNGILIYISLCLNGY